MPAGAGMRRVAIASCVGTTIEFYGFFIYGTAAALVFPKVFFPALGSTAGTVASFAAFAVAFIARPVGAVIFGHFGDRIGRKRTLISTLLLMGVATVTRRQGSGGGMRRSRSSAGRSLLHWPARRF
jgi:MFS family permease